MIHGDHLTDRQPGCESLRWLPPSEVRLFVVATTCDCSRPMYMLCRFSSAHAFAVIRRVTGYEAERVEETAPMSLRRATEAWSRVLSGFSR